MLSNANLFRRNEREQERMARATMPETARRETGPLAARFSELVAFHAGCGARLVLVHKQCGN
jgi:hypothetical protein